MTVHLAIYLHIQSHCTSCDHVCPAAAREHPPGSMLHKPRRYIRKELGKIINNFKDRHLSSSWKT